MIADGTHQVFECSMATVGKVLADVVVETRGRSWVSVVQRPKKKLWVYHFLLMPLQEKREATIGMLGVLLESQSEDVLRTVVWSAEKSWMP